MQSAFLLPFLEVIKTEKLYQIACSGWLKMFSSKKVHYSKKVYRNYPTNEQIFAFRKKCVEPDSNNDWYALNDDSTLELRVLELEVID